MRGSAADGAAGRRAHRLRSRTWTTSRGLVALAAVAGQTLHERLSDPTVRPTSELALDVKRVGVAMRSLHSLPRPHRACRHDGALREVGGRASLAPGGNDPRAHPRCGLAGGSTRCARCAVSPPLPTSPRWCTGTCTTSSWCSTAIAPVGLLDLDLATSWPPGGGPREPAGAPASSGCGRGVCTPAARGRGGSAALAGAATRRSPRWRDWPAVPTPASSRLRLAGVYAFRPATSGLVAHLLNSVTDNRQDVLR